MGSNHLAASSGLMLCRVDSGRPLASYTPQRASSTTAVSRTLTTTEIAPRSTKPSTPFDQLREEQKLQFPMIMGEPQGNDSDNWRKQIQSLDKAIGDPFCMMSSPYESLIDCYLMLQVLEQELDGCASAMIARLYYDAFHIIIAHGDQARASMFAERAYKARVICEGEDSPETLRVKSLAVKPAYHN
ncbi:uncharacterized protein TrAFT101_011971 [Trichoderma asperellum]|uniref:uncharacterized protein n=1 Tax=Trichoderma asperellum TaxID=101201 RepID=UPI00332CCD67|nr:hypothetical protein TrAFT101_011971 [Trichoderma asperellum]